MANIKEIEKIVNEALECDEKIKVKEATYIFCNVLDQLINDENGVFPFIRNELGQRVVVHLFHSIIGSYIGSLYTTVKFKGDLEGAIDYAKSAGVDEVKLDTKDGVKDVDIDKETTHNQA